MNLKRNSFTAVSLQPPFNEGLRTSRDSVQLSFEFSIELSFELSIKLHEAARQQLPFIGENQEHHYNLNYE